MTEYQKLLDAVANYYGAGSDQWLTIASQSNIQSTEWAQILRQTPNVNVITNKAGDIVSYTVNDSWGTAADTITEVVNSNNQVATMSNASQLSIPANNTVSQQGVAGATSGLKEYNGGMTVGGAMKAVLQSVAAVGAGIRLGAKIDATLYNLNPDFWDENNMSALNPETWDTLVSDYGDGASTVFNMFFGINKTTGKTTPYMDERALAYIAQYMSVMGAFDSGEPTSNVDTSLLNKPLYYNQPLKFLNLPVSISYTDSYGLEEIVWSGSGAVCLIKSNDDGVYYLSFIADAPNSIRRTAYRNGSEISDYYISLYNTTSITSGLSAYMKNEQPATVEKPVWISTYGDFINTLNANSYTLGQTSSQVFQDIATFYHYMQGGAAIVGIEPQDDATLPTGITADMSIDDVIDHLKDIYPDWWDDALYDDVIQDDGTITRHYYVPINLPDEITTPDHPTGGEISTQTDPTVDEDDEDLIETLLSILTGTDPANPTGTPPTDTTDYPDTGDGNTPAIVTPEGSASALYSIYNPTLAEVNALGAWLWSSNFVDQLLKLFNDPMQAIIGLHKVFATPPVSGRGNIKVGYLDSGVGANLVSAQYTEVDCGTVSLREYFGNALDYTHTDIYLYLPFVGIVPVSTVDVTRASINVKYKVDVLTGACLAQVLVNRDNNAGGQLYVYAGNCAVTYPISSGSYMGIVASVVGIAGSVAGTILSHGALLPMALGAGANALNSARTNVEHSGSLSGNAGAMGIKKPYFIIRRPQTKIADNFHVFNGQSNNVYDVLGNCAGYTRVKYVNLENIPATGGELTEIESILKNGVII